jgi:cytochrome c oxidase assembly factor CtaG
VEEWWLERHVKSKRVFFFLLVFVLLVFFFCGGVVLGIELRASHLLGRHSTRHLKLNTVMRELFILSLPKSVPPSVSPYQEITPPLLNTKI